MVKRWARTEKQSVRGSHGKLRSLVHTACVASLLLPASLLAVNGKSNHGKVAAPGPPPAKATIQPTQTIPVEPLGFAAPGQFYLGMRNVLASLDFLDETHLLFTFRVPGLLHRDPKSTNPSDERQIRAVVLQLPQGTVQAEAVWTVHDRKRYLWAIDDGQFLLRDRDTIQIGDATLQIKPFLHFPGDVEWMEMDPTNKYVVTESSEPPATASKQGDAAGPASAPAKPAPTLGDEAKPPAPQLDMVLRILRRDTGKVMLVTHVEDAVHLPLNDEGYAESIRGKANSWAINMNFFSGGSRILANVESECTPKLDFISAQVILATGCGGGGDPRLVAMTTGGQRLWEQPGSGSAIWPLLITSKDGSRLARETLLSNHSVNAMAPLGSEDLRGQDVQVLDTATGKQVLRAAASPVLDGGGNVAISPSGRKVAVLMAEGIALFDLPPAPAMPNQGSKPQPH